MPNATETLGKHTLSLRLGCMPSIFQCTFNFLHEFCVLFKVKKNTSFILKLSSIVLFARLKLFCYPVFLFLPTLNYFSKAKPKGL